MWCITTTSTCSPGVQPQQPGPQRHLHRQVKRLRRDRRATTAASPASATGVTGSCQSSPAGSSTCWYGWPPSAGKTVRSTSCRPATSASAARQRGGIQLPGQPQRDRDVVQRRRALQLGEEPQPLLGERQRHPRPAACRAVSGGPGRARRRQPHRQPRRGRRLEHRPHRQLGAQHRPDPADQPDRQQRVPAQGEEVVLRPDPLQAEHLGEDPAQDLLLHACAGPRPLAGRGESGGGQRRAVELAVGGQRQRVQHHERRGHHVLRQPGRGMLPRQPPPARHRSRAVAGGDQVGGQPLVAGRVLADGHRGLGRRRVQAASTASTSPGSIRNPRILTWSSARPAKISSPSGRPAGQVAGAVHPLPRPAERAGGEPLRGQRRPVQVAAGQPRSGDVQLPGHPGRDRAQPLVQHVDPGVGQRGADRRAAPARPAARSWWRTTVVSVGP